MTTTRRFGLDLIRALAIILVIFHHYRHIPGCPEWLSWGSLRSYIGVDLFFVLSGWLIGGQIIRKYRTTGRVDVVQFWVRRWFRTLPCYFIILGVVWCLGDVASRNLPYFFLFIQNYVSPGSWLISWSLCIEEQFYIVLPLLFLLSPLLFRSPNAWWVTCLFFVLISPVLRYLTLEQLQSVSYVTFIREFYVITHLRLEGLSLGVALAILAEYRAPFWLWMERHAGKLAFAGGMMIIISTWSPHLTGTTVAGVARMTFFPWVFGFFFVSLGTAMSLPFANTVELSGLWTRGVTIISEHAYTLYLLHEFGRDIVLEWLPGLPFSAAFALSFGLSFILATALRFAVEIPGLKARDWIIKRRTASAFSSPETAPLN